MFEAIKAARTLQHCNMPLTIYRSDRSEYTVYIFFGAHLVDYGLLDGVGLTFLSISNRPSSAQGCGRPGVPPEPCTHRTLRVLDAGRRAYFPAPFSATTRRLRAVARAEYNRAVGRELAELESGQGESGEGGSALFNTLLSGLDAE